MLDPRKWEYVDRLRLLIAAAFGALLGFTNGYSHGWFNILWALVGAVVVGGAFYCYRALIRPIATKCAGDDFIRLSNF
jgi:hypothetical protein